MFFSVSQVNSVEQLTTSFPTMYADVFQILPNRSVAKICFCWRFFVFPPPRIEPQKKDRVFCAHLKVKWRLLRPLETWDDLWVGTVRANMTSCDLISCKVDKSTRFLCLRRSVFFGLFLGFYHFSIFYRAITKNISESTCDNSSWLPISLTKSCWRPLSRASLLMCFSTKERKNPKENKILLTTTQHYWCLFQY